MIGPEKWVSSFSFREHDVLRRWLALSCVWKERENEQRQAWPIEVDAGERDFFEI
jgi:hypothetical protein